MRAQWVAKNKPVVLGGLTLCCSSLGYSFIRLRQLSRILGKDAKGGVKDVNLLMSEGFRELVGGKPVDLATAEEAMKTLFGMVVKERRRVASLAKTVGTFEARASQAEVEKEKEKEAREKERRRADVERAKMEREHERNLGALMMVVSGEEDNSAVMTAADGKVKVMEEKVRECGTQRTSYISPPPFLTPMTQLSTRLATIVVA